MIYDKICVMCPTYGRSETKLPKFINSIIETADDLKRIMLMFVVNKNDSRSSLKITTMCSGVVTYVTVREDTEECNLSTYFNMAYNHEDLTEPGMCVSMFGDDMVFLTKGWDTVMLNKINEMYGAGIVYGDDDYCQHQDLCVYFITSREFVEMTEKPFMCELFAVDFMDNVWMELSKKLNCAAYLPNLHVRHEHAMRDKEIDDTWNRNRSQYDRSSKNHEFINNYTSEMAATVRKNLSKKYLSTDISYCMTTYDRIEVLRRTVNSWNKSVILPDRLFVFDDGSKDIHKIEHEINRMTRAYLVCDGEHLGCNCRNVRAIRYFNTPAVMVLDSDTAFDSHWCIAANDAWDKIKDDPDIAGVTLFNTKQHETIDRECAMKRLNYKATVGGFGTIYKREVIDGALGSDITDDMPVTWSWDNHVNDWVKKRSKIYCCTKKSYLQHTGYVEGTHTSDEEMSDYAYDYIGEIEYARPMTPEYSSPLPVRQSIVSDSDVLFSAMARLGDVIAASMIANMIINRGLRLTWIVIPRYEGIVHKICPEANVTTIDPMVGGPQGEWSEMTTEKMMKKFPGYRTYINAQIGSRENHYEYTTSGKHPCVWIRDLCNKTLGISLGDNFREHLIFNPAGATLSERTVKVPDKLALLSREAVTSQSFTTNKMVVELFAKLRHEGYSPRFLVEKRPEGCSIRQLREEYIYGLTIEQCILLIQKAALFVGQDSGLAWCSLYSNCKKRIYHNKDRIEMVNTRFSQIDVNAEDIVI